MSPMANISAIANQLKMKVATKTFRNVVIVESEGARVDAGRGSGTMRTI